LMMGICLIGCGGPQETTLTGTVKFGGKPVYNGTVRLLFDDDNQAQGTIAIDGTGTYHIRTAYAGHARVAIDSPKPAEVHERDKRAGPAKKASTNPDPKEWFAIPEKYADPAQSGKEVTLKAGSNTIDFDLE